MPSVDENSNMTDGDGRDGAEVKAHKKCSCCPFGYHIHLDFVPFSEKMLAGEENGERMQNLRALKEKWRSERQSMDKLLGLQDGPWKIKISPEARHDKCEFSTRDSTMTFHFPNKPIPYGRNETSTSGGLEDAVVEFEDVLARAKQDNKPSYPFSNDQNFHTYPRLHKTGRDGEARTKTKIPMKTITGGIVSGNKVDFWEVLTDIPAENGTASASLSMEDIEDSSNDVRHWARIQAMEEQIQLIPQLITTVANLTLENQNYIELLNEEKRKRRKLEEKIKSLDGVIATSSSHQQVEAEKSLGRKRMRDASVGSTLTTRDVGVSCIEEISARFFGVGGRIDSCSFERDSASPTGSLNGRRRGRTFEIGIQVNDTELLEKDPPPPLLLIVEKHDTGSQTELDKMVASKYGLGNLLNEERIPKVMKSVGCTIKPKTSDSGILAKPLTRDEASNSIKIVTRDRGIGTMPFVYSRASGDTIIPQSIVEHNSIGVNTVGRQVEDAAVNTAIALWTTAAQTESVGNQDFGMQTPPTSPPRLNAQQFTSVPTFTPPTSDRIDSRAQGTSSHPFPETQVLTAADEQKRSRSAPENRPTSKVPKPLPPPPSPKPSLMRSNTYTKDIPLDKDLSDGVSIREQDLEMPSTSEPKHVASTSVDLSITTIPERREAIKPSKEMQGALKVLNDALLRGKTTQHVASAIGIILHEWFRVSGSKSASAEDVEDYLDLYESYSPELLKYVVNMPDGNGNTAMHYAVSHGNFNVVSVLLDSNCCDINRPNKAGYNCIMLLSLASILTDTDRSVVARLCSLGDVNTKAPQHGQTALMLAASQGQLETCHALLTAGADINIRDDDGSTALMCAAEHGHARLVTYFVGITDCDLHMTDNDGSTALNVAMQANHKDVGVTLYAHMHLMGHPKSNQRRLSYPTYTELRLRSSGTTTMSMTRSAGNSPSTLKKLQCGIAAESEEEDAGASSPPQ